MIPAQQADDLSGPSVLRKSKSLAEIMVKKPQYMVVVWAATWSFCYYFRLSSCEIQCGIAFPVPGISGSGRLPFELLACSVTPLRRSTKEVQSVRSWDAPEWFSVESVRWLVGYCSALRFVSSSCVGKLLNRARKEKPGAILTAISTEIDGESTMHSNLRRRTPLRRHEAHTARTNTKKSTCRVPHFYLGAHAQRIFSYHL